MMPGVFLILSKILDLLLGPLTWALLLLALALLWQGRRPGRARAAAVLSLVVLLAFSLDPVSRWLFGRLEARAPDTFRPEPPYDVVVLLGGVLEGPVLPGQPIELNNAAERLLAAADLVRSGQAGAVLVSGGNAFPRPGEAAESEVLAAWLRAHGVPPERIVCETRSRNTRENATESAPIIAARGWKRVLLVTSAWHVPRALGCFRAVGLSPDVLPVDHRAAPGPGYGWLPRAAALSASTDALRETFGGLVYRVMGYAR